MTPAITDLVWRAPFVGFPYSGYEEFITEYAFRFHSCVLIPYDDAHHRADPTQAASATARPEGLRCCGRP